MKGIASGLVLALALSAPTQAQQRPVEGVRGVERGPLYRGERGARDEGRFILRDHDGTLYLLDTETGCAWSRASGNFGVNWYYEGPRGGGSDCDAILRNARRSVEGGK
ncbi:MAG: hypothetical protein R3E18_06150 [Sphingomonadaceae bacterium]|nr:hypothetical protein [Sphingomonadaceae bacterium]